MKILHFILIYVLIENMKILQRYVDYVTIYLIAHRTRSLIILIGGSNVEKINFVGIPSWRKQSQDYHDRIAMVAKRMHGPGCTLPFPLLWNRDFTSTANLVTQSRKFVLYVRFVDNAVGFSG